MTADLAALPHLQEIFERLRSGRHLCADDGVLYTSLRDRMTDYQRLFAALGFELVDHERGFCYFRSAGELGKEASAQAVFFLVLVEAWSDEGLDLQAKVFDTAGHNHGQLPHFDRESWRVCMTEAGVRTADDLADVLKRLERLGFTERVDDESFRFRAPTWRFLDLCREVLEEEEARADSRDNADTPEEEPA